MKMKILDNPAVRVRDGRSSRSLEGAITELNKRLNLLGMSKKLREKESFEKPGDKRRRKKAADTKRTIARLKNVKGSRPN